MFVRSHGTIQRIWFRNIIENVGKWDFVHLDSGAEENFASLTTVQESGWGNRIYNDSTAPLVYTWGSRKNIPSRGYVDIRCKFFYRSRLQRQSPWMPLRKEKFITFRVLAPEDEGENRPECPFVIGKPFMLKNRIVVP
jgi:hypothetical protein